MMPQPHFSVSWNEHPKNITTGLSSLQQNSEFVDMTLAADGHFVKVHQVLMALSSPYIKDLISSTQCKHPVIFLNKVSYTTLTAILQYIYTGEVLVGFEDLRNLIDAAQELHIKGLQDMKVSYTTLSAILEYIYTGQVLVAVDELKNLIDAAQELHIKGLQDMDLTQFLSAGRQKTQNELAPQSCHTEDLGTPTKIILDSSRRNVLSCKVEEMQDVQHLDDTMDTLSDSEESTTKTITTATSNVTDSLPSKNSDGSNLGALQYTVSNQGSLQMILNRFVYYLKHTNRDRTRQWRCVDYITNHHCPAYVSTRNDVVVQRILAHNHPFHDKRILKKLKNGTIFSAIQEAETEGINKKNKAEENK